MVKAAIAARNLEVRTDDDGHATCYNVKFFNSKFTHSVLFPLGVTRVEDSTSGIKFKLNLNDDNKSK
jgi:hypothetical protein